MNKIILAAIVLVATSFGASAEDLTTKVMKDNPGVTGAGITANPTTKPVSGGLAEKAMRDLPGVSANGRTVNPTAKIASGSLSDAAVLR
jgi:hypothetical protein